ncbi:MAG: CmcJ/NvfI family oxidoreductase [Pseudomonadota bacterium]
MTIGDDVSTAATLSTRPIRAAINCIRRDTDIEPRVTYSGGAEPQIFNDAYALATVDIEDARNSERRFALDVNGFEWAKRPTAFNAFDDESAISNVYYDEVAAIIREITGTKDVFVFDHTVRRGLTESTRKPAYHVHNDYTEETGRTRAREVLGEEIVVKMEGRRMLQINVWRPLNDVVKRSPLAFCDASSVKRADLVATKIYFPETDRTGEILALRRASDQRWWYIPAMTKDEVVLIKGYDTKRDGVARFTPHTAFEFPDDLQEHDAPPRESIEARAFAFY